MNTPTWLIVAFWSIIGLGLLITFVQFLIEYSKEIKTRTNTDALIGQKALLLEDYEFLKPATIWRVKSFDNQPLNKETLVEVVGIEGNTLIVQKYNK